MTLHAQQPKDAKMDVFVTQLMKKMTIDEKIGQLNLQTEGDIVTGVGGNSLSTERLKKGLVGGMFNIKGAAKIRAIQKIAVEQSRLKIPVLFGMDVIHGYETIFPIPLGLACTWDMPAIEQSARIAAIEASSDGICWTFSPMVDITRDPRWGRVAEAGGEDPYLGGRIAEAMVTGYQGKDNFSSNTDIMSCVKHFALYGAVEAGRDYNPADMSTFRMFNDYLYPYQAAVDAGAGSVMASFNSVNGTPAHANRWLLTDVLRKQWHFNGFTVADYGGVGELVNHGLGNIQQVSARALKAGLDVDMVSEGYLSTLKKSYQEGKVTLAEIDAACRRMLEAKYKLGLFANPYKYCDESRASKSIYTPEHLAIARKTAAESFVLLKNEQHLLPLKPGKTIAVIGPLANTRSNMVGTWSVAADLTKPATVVEGLQAAAGPDTKIIYAKGSNLFADSTMEANGTMFGRKLDRDNRTDNQLRAEAIKAAEKADVIVAVMGEASEMSGESSSRTDISIPDVQENLLKELVKTGKPVVLVLFTGRPLTLVWEDKNVPAILNVWFGGSEAANAIGDVVYGKVSPSGRLVSTFPRSVGQIPLYYNNFSTGRPASDHGFEKFRSNYMDEKNAPLYPFGYGLSYTHFSYGDIKLSASELSTKSNVTAAIEVKNDGKEDGDEIVQLYIHQRVGSTVRPVKELKGFQRIHLKAGEAKTVRFTIDNDMLKYYNADLAYKAEPGDFDVMIGTNSRDVKSTKLTLK
ncbi:beta-glucosidase BglX [Mucilaginibacter sp. L196]|uniref:beta-glucosidase BglX n=1 Tax=Mucilaginibacter sp. L196 TaxID=1641870 RepID=UPI00352C1943